MLLECDQYLMIYIASDFQYQCQPQDSWAQVMMVELYVLESANFVKPQLTKLSHPKS
jgi:hypothetical protein